MKHQKKGRKFGRVRNQRKALLKGLAVNLIMNKKIKTTLPKAKELRKFAERLITLAKKGENVVLAYRNVQKFLPKIAASRLVKDIAPMYKSRSGGYTRIIKTPRRTRDAAEMGYIEFV